MDETTTYLYPLMLTSEELAEVTQALPKSSTAKEKAEQLWLMADGNERSMAAERNYKAIIEAEDAEIWELD